MTWLSCVTCNAWAPNGKHALHAFHVLHALYVCLVPSHALYAWGNHKRGKEKEKGENQWFDQSINQASYVLNQELNINKNPNYLIGDVSCLHTLKWRVQSQSQSLSIYLKYFLAKASTNFESFRSRIPMVPPHDPHIVMDFHDNVLLFLDFLPKLGDNYVRNLICVPDLCSSRLSGGLSS